MVVIVILASAIVALIVDQATKERVRSRLQEGETMASGGRLVRYVVNRGPGRGFAIGRTALGLIWAVEVALVLTLARLVPSFQSIGGAAGLGLVLGGATGNLLDRVRLRGVIDFIDLHFWPVFNLADLAIVAGILLEVALVL